MTTHDRKLCTGPFGKGCPTNRKHTPLSPRCVDCQDERNRILSRERNRIRRAQALLNPAPSKPCGGPRVPGLWAQQRQAQEAQDIAQARAVQPEEAGFLGALKVLSVMQQVAA